MARTGQGLAGVRAGLVMAGAACAVAILGAAGAGAAPPAPVILNSASSLHWMESDSLPQAGSGRFATVTFVVNHPVGRSITALAIDRDFDGSDESALVATTPVTGQTINGFTTSRVTYTFDPGSPAAFSCPFLGTATRRVTVPLSFRVVDNTGERSASVVASVQFVDDSNCTAHQDFPRITSTTQSASSVVPGQDVTFSFVGDDPDPEVSSSDDDFDRINWRWRRLNDGATGGSTLRTGLNDNTTASLTTSFPARGRYVLEAELGNENGNFPNAGNWWRLGAVDVNQSVTSLSGSLSFQGPGGLVSGSPPSVNAGATVDAVANVSDTGGAVQQIDWDADNNGVFERTERTNAARFGNAVTQSSVSGAQLTQSMSTASFGLRHVNVRISDSAALDIVDANGLRRTLTFSGALRVNAVPSATAAAVGASEDVPRSITLMGSDADNQPAALSYEIVSGPSHGALGPLSGGTTTYTPDANYSGTDSFTFRTKDGPVSGQAWSYSNTATVSITVAPVNDVPVADPQSLSTAEDTVLALTLTGSDVEDAFLAFAIDGAPAHGSVTCVAATCLYRPDPNFSGTDAFVFSATDSGGASGSATVEVTVDPVNDAPAAVDMSVNAQEDTAQTVLLAAGDADGDDLDYAVGDPQHGSLVCTDADCTYTPHANYHGPDSFTFTVTDPDGLSDSGLVELDVVSVNDAPVATPKDVAGDEDTPVSVLLEGEDVDGDPLAAATVTAPTDGTLSSVTDNSVTYSPNPNWYGSDAFEFSMTDPLGATSEALVRITIRPVNDAPVVGAHSVTTDEDTPLAVSVPAVDVDGDALSWSVVDGPDRGTLTGTGPDFDYEPNANFHGTDSFVVSVGDPDGASDTATVTIVVTPVNDAPDAEAENAATSEDVATTFTLDATDVDGEALAYAVTTAPQHGVLACVGGSCTYTPNPNFNGTDAAVFQATDPSGAFDTAAIRIDVTPVNDAPAAGSLNLATAEDTAVAVTLSGTDVDGDSLSYQVAAPSRGTLSGVAPDLVYTPAPNAHGTDSFAYVVRDGRGGQATGQVAITIAEVNDPPVAANATVANLGEPSVTFTLVAVDADGDPLTFAVVAPPASGAASCTPAGACSYTPNAGFVGNDGLRFSVADGRGGTATGVVTFVVTPVDPATQLEILLAKTAAFVGGPPERALRQHLANALRHVEANRPKQACGSLSAYSTMLRTVPVLVVTNAQRAELLAAVQRVRDALDC